MELALATGIPPAVWAEEGEQAIATAVELLRRQDEDQDAGGGRQLSG